MVFLLDVNVLLALFDKGHIHHEPAHRWFKAFGINNWSSSPITENGFIRIASRQDYPNRPGDPNRTAILFRRFRDQSGHHFWADSITLLDSLLPENPIFPSQVTDVYLLGLAVQQGGKLATFDRKIPTQAVEDGDKALEILE